MNARKRPKKVWITGASAGLGAALAHAYALRGSKVALTSRSRDNLLACAAALPSPALGQIYPADVTKRVELEATINQFEEDGPIELAILNAGTYQPMAAEEWNTPAIRALFETNFFSITTCIELLLPLMRGRGGGHLAIVASVAGDIGLPYAAPYSASKAALNRICESLRPELELDGITLSVINPGFVRTPLTAQNEFPMPFLMEADQAAEIIFRQLARGKLNIRFPRRMSYLMRCLALLPAPLKLSVARRMLHRNP